MKNLKIAVIYLFLSIFSITYSFSQDHEHKAPHGGSVKSAGDYHIEMVMKDKKMTFYIYDATMKPVKNAGINGNIVLQYEKNSATEKLMPESTDHFMVSMKEGHVMSCDVTFTIGAKKVSAKFEHKDMDMMDMKNMNMKKSDGHNHEH